MVEKDFSHDEQAHMALEKLLVRRGKQLGTTSTTECSGGKVVSFVNKQKLHSLLHEKPFDLTKVSNKLELLLQKWARRHASSRGPPTLIQLEYNPISKEGEELLPNMEDQESENEHDLRSPPGEVQSPLGLVDNNNNENESPPFTRPLKRKQEEQHEQHVAKLITARRNLCKDGGKDPMQEILAKAASASAAVDKMREPATTTRTTTLYDKKPSAKRVQFDDTESDEEDNEEEEVDDDDEEEEADVVILSDLPTRARIVPSKQQESSVTKLVPRTNHGKRMKFTDDEKRAIREGVRTHGVGKWSQIKSEYAIILKNRTTINIKVRELDGYYPQRT